MIYLIFVPRKKYIRVICSRVEGREFIDIGPDFAERRLKRINPAEGRSPSEPYGFERRDLQGYDNYRRVYERRGKYQGGTEEELSP